MSNIAVSDLLTSISQDVIRARMVETLVTMGVPADQWRKGGVASTILTAAAAVLAMFSSLIVTFISGFFLPTAFGTGLKLLAQFMYGVIVPDATFATGNVTLTNSGGGVYNLAAGAYTVANTATKVTYTNLTAFTLNATSSLTISMRATVGGSSGNAVPGAITTQVSALLGVTVTNPNALVGVDAPTDDAIRQLCTNKLGALSVRGVRTAYAYAVQVATNSVTGAPVNINRWAITTSSHVGTVDLYLASPSGVPDATDVTGVANSVEAIARPDAVTANAIAATQVPYGPTISVWCSTPSGVSNAQLVAAIANEILKYISAYPIGGITANDDTHTGFTGLFASGISGAVARGAASVNAVLYSIKGAVDLALLPGQVAVDNTSVSVTLIPPSSGVIV